MVLKNFIQEIKEHVLNELKNKEVVDLLKTYIIEPSICHVLDKLYPYIIIVVVIIILLLILLITILINIYTIKKIN
jgi:hypothetical protein